MLQNTKIVTTIGPSTEHSKQIETLIKEGTSVFRFNMKHNTYDWHKATMNKVRKVASKLNTEVGIMADLQGPELRTGNFPNGADRVTLNIGDNVVFGSEPLHGFIFIPFNTLDLVSDISIHDHIYIDDGRVGLSVTSVGKTGIKAKIIHGSELGNRKSVSIPNGEIKVPTLLTKDKADVKFALENHVDFIALSFVRDGRDITTLKKMIKRLGGTQHIVAKIETNKSITNIKEIVAETDALMVARGDLGIEVPIERVPRIQELIIKEARTASKPVIVATQMLMSMIRTPVPSRAEVSDIANSVMDKTDALMLSEETTTGNFPIEAVRTMAKIARYNEPTRYTHDLEHDSNTFEELIIRSSVEFSNVAIPTQRNEIKGYVVFTESGKSARVLSRYRTPMPVFAFTSYLHVARQLSLSYGVKPFKMKLDKDPIINIRMAEDVLKKNRSVGKGDKLVVIFGNNVGVAEANNTISIITI